MVFVRGILLMFSTNILVMKEIWKPEIAVSEADVDSPKIQQEKIAAELAATRDTNRVEAELESGSWMSRISDVFEKVSRYGKIFALGTLLQFSPLEAEAKAPHTERALSPEEIETVVSKTGMTPEEIHKKFHFRVEFLRDNGNDRYVIHIGQTHKSPTLRTMPDEKIEPHVRKVVDVQENIAGLFREMKERGHVNGPIFCEGLTEGGEYLKEIRRTRLEVSELIENNKGFSAVADSFENMLRGHTESSTEFVVALCYIYRKAFETFPEIAETDRGRKIAATYDTYLSDADILFVAGGVEQLFLGGEIDDIVGAETRMANKRAIVHVNELQVYALELEVCLREMELLELEYQRAENMKQRSDITHKMAELGARMKQLKKPPEANHIERESVAIQCIGERIGDRKQDVFLVYGAAHNFSKAIEAHVKKNPNGDFGLIRLIPDTTRSVR